MAHHTRSWRSRLLRAVVSAISVLSVGAGLFWFAIIPHWRPELREGERFGIDVSNHQGMIAWDLVAADGIEFAYVKASEGQGWVDASFDRNWDGAAEAGLERGAYHFFTLCAAGEEQARNFLAVAPPETDALPPAVDVEFPGNCSARPPVDEVAAELDAFVEIVEQAWGVDVLVYVGRQWDVHYPVKERLGRDIWQPSFLVRPDDDWLIWQLHGLADVDGIDGDVDLDVMRHD